MSQFQTVNACVFDAYGTLFDVHSAIGRHRDRLGEAADQVSALWRTKQLEYTWLRSLMGRYADFRQVTEDALEYTFDTFAIADGALQAALMEAYERLECYPEVPETLARLKQGGRTVAILSNGTPAMLATAVENAGLKDLIDIVLSVDALGIYKPDPRVYRLTVDRLGVQASEISFQSSNGWDVAGAASFGFRVVWVNRLGQRRERLPYGPDAELRTLSGLPPLLGLD